MIVGTTWKMNKNADESTIYIRELKEYLEKNNRLTTKMDIFVLPTFLSVYSVCLLLEKSKLKYGAQNCCWEDEGAYTGEISPMHLKDMGCTYVELGHAERRKIFKENDVMINKKVKASLRNKLQPILCIGEEKKYKNEKDTSRILKNQLLLDLENVSKEDIDRVIIAYEPIWAIGAKNAAPIDFINNTVSKLREIIKEKYGIEAGKKQKIIYGGSVNPDSASDILKLKNVDGIFIGRAGLKLDYFIEMIEMAYKESKKKDRI